MAASTYLTLADPGVVAAMGSGSFECIQPKEKELDLSAAAGPTEDQPETPSPG